ncbi:MULTISPECIES: OmpA family protein [Marinobacter]|uniref:OmpA family protein n=1 Tax=Marinobacter TaxID=2742 RepID=UPI000DAB6ED3|nr:MULTISPECIES: OmpA family protein [Marinobacter]
MTKRILMSGSAATLALLLSACASGPAQNAKVDEARSAYQAIEDDPYVARAGSTQLRQSELALKEADSLLEEGADTDRVEQAAYLARSHAEIASQQGERARLQEEIASAQSRREQLKLQQAQSEADRLRAEMEALQAEQTERGMVLTLGDVLFDVNKADLKPAGERTVQRLADFMAEYPERRVRVEGYTDSTGAASYNQQLSERRAESVRNSLMLEGIDSGRVEVIGHGEDYPVASNDTSSGRQQNRRVEIVISDQQGMIKSR